MAGRGVSLLMAATMQVAPAPPPEPVERKAEAASPPTSVDELVITAPAAKPPPKLNLDVRGDFAAPEIPYLNRRPTKGCKPMAGGSSHPMEKSGAAGGIVCAFRF